MTDPNQFDFIKTLSEFYPAMQPGIPVIDFLRVHYWLELRKIAKADPAAAARMPGMIVAPDKMNFYIGKTHVAVEYFGPISVPPNLDDDDAIKVIFTDCRDDADFIESIVGMKFMGSGIKLALMPGFPCTNLFIPTSSEAIFMMTENGWDMFAEDIKFSVNASGVLLPHNDFARMVNCFFYSVEHDPLRTRRIQWIDFFPLTVSEHKETETTIEEELEITLWPDFAAVIDHDSKFTFPYPATFETERLALLNRFRELLLTPGVAEPAITAWLAQPQHQFILKMALPATYLLHQAECDWKTDSSRPSLIPDFFAVRANGYADIVEFKLPELKGSAVVGQVNRETFSAKVNSYIAQTRTYKEYFQESVHRQHVKEKHGLNVNNPKRVLVMGRRWEFAADAWRTVQGEFPDLTVLTYDDLIDSVAALLYQNPKA